MAHREYVRLVPGAKNAVLFIHGIVGTPNHFVKAVDLQVMVPETWSVYNLLLYGHGGTVRDFSNSSMNVWKAQVQSIFLKLAETHERVLVVGHSMGTLFALSLGLEFPDKIPELFLLAVPLRPWLRLYGIRNCLRLAFGRVREEHPLETATRDACGVVTTWRLWEYLGWIPRYLELFAEIARTEKQLSSLAIPCTAFQSGVDELVSNRTRRVLEKSGTVNIVDLPQSGHFYYAPADRKRVERAFAVYLEAYADPAEDRSHGRTS